MYKEEENSREKCRVFFAVEISAALRDAAKKIIRYLQQQPQSKCAKWVKPEKMHLTLRFVGEVPRDKLAEITTNVAARVKKITTFAVNVGDVHAFPSHRPHVLAIAIELSQELAELVRAIDEGVVEAGFPPEKRPFLPHLTLARLRGKAPLFNHVPVKMPKSFNVDEVVLFESQLEPQGSRYTPLWRYHFINRL